MADTMGTTQSANFIPEIWGRRALGKLEAELHLARNVARDSEYVTATEGDVVHIQERGTLTANAKTSGNAVTLQNPTASKVDVTLDQHFEVTFAVEDIAKAQANQDIMDGYIEDAIVVLGEKIETALATLYSSMGNTLGTGNTDLTDAVLKSCRSTLSNNRAPAKDRFLYLAPEQIDVILGLSKFVDASQYGSATPVQDGEFGKIYGMRVFESLFTQTSGSPATTHNLAMHRNAMVLATRPLPEPKAPGAVASVVEKDGIMMRVIYSYNADQLADQVTIDMLYGVSAFRSALGINLKS